MDIGEHCQAVFMWQAVFYDMRQRCTLSVYSISALIGVEVSAGLG